MADSVPALIVGGVLVLLAAGMAWFQFQYRQPLDNADDLARQHAVRQLRRRLQVSAMLAVVGILIPLGDILPLFRRAPVAFVFFWVAVLVLTGWIALLAVADLASSRAYHGRASRRLEQQRAQLENELARLRSQGNGSHSHNGN